MPKRPVYESWSLSWLDFRRWVKASLRVPPVAVKVIATTGSPWFRVWLADLMSRPVTSALPSW